MNVLKRNFGGFKSGLDLGQFLWAGGPGRKPISCFFSHPEGLGNFSGEVGRAACPEMLQYTGCALAFFGPGATSQVASDQLASYTNRMVVVQVKHHWERFSGCKFSQPKTGVGEMVNVHDIDFFTPQDTVEGGFHLGNRPGVPKLGELGQSLGQDPQGIRARLALEGA
jgi:hypothetical protein